MPVSDIDLSTLAASHDIINLGMLADTVRRERHGVRTTFVRVADVSSEVGAPMVWPEGTGEVRIVGVPVTLAAALARVAEVVFQGKGVSVSAFSLADLEQLAGREHVTLRSILEDLHAAGLDLVADAPFDQLQNPRRCVEEVNIGGLALGRLTIHQLPATDALALFKQVAELQYNVAVIRAFAPLPRRINPAVPTTGFDDVKRVALARLTIQNIPSIQVDWALYGPKLAQVALTVGADDVDGVSPDEDTGQGRRRSPLEEIRRNIRAAGQEPVERNGRFEMITR
jgi:hypothetical protein